MGVIREQFRWSKLKLQHEDASDFYLSCWQSNRMALPLLCVRFVLFLGCVGILLSSMLLPERIIFIQYWAIFMTQWGVIMLVVTSGLATAVSAVAYFKGPIDATFGLPWYVRLFWACMCIAVPQAYQITIFYYSFLLPADFQEIEYELNPVLDAFSHGINSVIMFTLLMSSNVPFYCIQCIYLALFYIIYMVFSIIYYYAGGTNPFGDPYIYPVLDWSKPGEAVATVFISLAILVVVYAIVMAMTLLRDYVSRRFRNTTLIISDKQ